MEHKCKNKEKMMPLEYAAKEIRSENAQTSTRKLYPLHDNNGNQGSRQTETRQAGHLYQHEIPYVDYVQ
jgi:hypothetical protein